MGRALLPAVAAGLLLALAGCAGAAPAPSPSAGSATPASQTPTPTSTQTPTPTPTPTVADPIAGLTLEQKVGQLFMVGTSVAGANPTTLAAVSDDHVGGVFLSGRSSAGVEATAQLVATFTAASASAGAPAPLWVATDQEGGDVQVLTGPGFDAIPSALEQGQQDTGALSAAAAQWGAQLSQAGVNLNLAPVADIVTNPQTAGDNPPIGQLDREYGYDESAVSAKAGAFAQGMREGGVTPTFKHFPGLGHVGGNTDFSAGVTDDFVTADGPDVDEYRGLVAGGPALVMMSTAIYNQIDPSAPAAFSPAVVGVLRQQIGFDGVITTDDLSSATQVSAWSPSDRATLAIDAGVDLVLVSNDPAVFPEMYQAVLSRAQGDPTFAAKVDTSARRVLEAKASLT